MYKMFCLMLAEEEHPRKIAGGVIDHRRSALNLKGLIDSLNSQPTGALFFFLWLYAGFRVELLDHGEEAYSKIRPDHRSNLNMGGFPSVALPPNPQRANTQRVTARCVEMLGPVRGSSARLGKSRQPTMKSFAVLEICSLLSCCIKLNLRCPSLNVLLDCSGT